MLAQNEAEHNWSHVYYWVLAEETDPMLFNYLFYFQQNTFHREVVDHFLTETSSLSMMLWGTETPNKGVFLQSFDWMCHQTLRGSCVCLVVQFHCIFPGVESINPVKTALKQSKNCPIKCITSRNRGLSWCLRCLDWLRYTGELLSGKLDDHFGFDICCTTHKAGSHMSEKNQSRGHQTQ